MAVTIVSWLCMLGFWLIAASLTYSAGECQRRMRAYAGRAPERQMRDWRTSNCWYLIGAVGEVCCVAIIIWGMVR